MIDVKEWVNCLTKKLQAAFQERLLFVGLQGSYQREEATEQSDIDIVVLLDRIELQDLACYRKLLSDMPHSELACGFICGRLEFRNWPKYELFQFFRGTTSFYGDLSAFMPEIGEEEATQSLKIGASALYHEICHQYLYGKQDLACLQHAFKTSFYLLQLSYYLKTKDYILTKSLLCQKLSGTEKEILEISSNWEPSIIKLQENPAHAYDLLLGWTSAVLRQYK